MIKSNGEELERSVAWKTIGSASAYFLCDVYGYNLVMNTWYFERQYLLEILTFNLVTIFLQSISVIRMDIAFFSYLQNYLNVSSVTPVRELISRCGGGDTPVS